MAIRGVLLAYVGLGWVLRLLLQPFVSVYNTLFKPIALELYLSLFSSKKIWRSFLRTSHNVWHNLINQRITLYILLAFVFSLIITTNIQAREIPPEDLGKDSIMFALVAEDTAVGIIEDTTLPRPTEVARTTTEGLAVSGEDEEIAETPEENTVLIAIGGSSILAAADSLTPRTRTGIEEYTVQSGDTVTSIAKQFGISVNSILWGNDLKKYTIIRPGDTLKILPFSGIIHTIESGDTVASLAKKFSAEESEISRVNKLTSAGLQVGEALLIPGGIPPAPKVVPRPPAPQPTTIARAPSTPPPAAVDSGTQMLWPAVSRRINQSYHWRHRGLDIDGDTGDPVYASESGTVEASGWNRGGYGNRIIINHGGGIKTLYAHNSQNLVSVGETVTRGQVIGYVGSTGRSTGPHIHYEVRVNGRTVNPLLYTK